LELVEPRPLQPKVKGFVVAPAGGVQMVMNGQRQAQPLAAEALIN
jgi:hypothetical protein